LTTTPLDESPGAALPQPARKAPRGPARRHHYVATRLGEIAAEAGEIVKWRDHLFADLKIGADGRAPSRDEVRVRRAYLAERLAIIRMEEAELNAEKAAMDRAGE
jgi:hypothetical protein